MSRLRPGIVPIDDLGVSDVTEAVGTVFGPRSADRFRWNLLVAREARPTLRPPDTVAVARARQPGAFPMLLDVALEQMDTAEDVALISNTPNDLEDVP